VKTGDIFQDEERMALPRVYYGFRGRGRGTEDRRRRTEREKKG